MMQRARIAHHVGRGQKEVSRQIFDLSEKENLEENGKTFALAMNIETALAYDRLKVKKREEKKSLKAPRSSS